MLVERNCIPRLDEIAFGCRIRGPSLLTQSVNSEAASPRCCPCEKVVAQGLTKRESDVRCAPLRREAGNGDTKRAAEGEIAGCCEAKKNRFEVLTDTKNDVRCTAHLGRNVLRRGTEKSRKPMIFDSVRR